MFGFGFTVIMEIAVNNENKNDLVKFVREHPDVLMCIEGIGVCDVLAISKEYSIEKVQKFIGKINNGFSYWFTFVIHPGVEPTNNRAERALRPQVVLRKIMGTLRNEKGTSIHERIMTTLATWGQRGPDCLQMLTAKLES
jgi:hypothetical protein